MMSSCSMGARGKAMPVKGHIQQIYSASEVQGMIRDAYAAAGGMTEVEKENSRKIQQIVKG